MSARVTVYLLDSDMETAGMFAEAVAGLAFAHGLLDPKMATVLVTASPWDTPANEMLLVREVAQDATKIVLPSCEASLGVQAA